MDEALLKDKNKTVLWIGHLRRFFRLTWVPIVLIVLFVCQNQLFNNWLAIDPGKYFLRRGAITAALGLLLFGPAVLFKKRTKYLYLGFVSLFVALLFVIQFLYYRYSGDLLQASALLYARQGLSVLSTARALLSYRLLLFLVGPIIVAIAWLLENRGYGAEPAISKKGRVLIALLITACSIISYGGLFIKEQLEYGTATHWYEIYGKLYDTDAMVGQLGVINFTVGDALVLGLGADQVNAADRDFVESWQQAQPVKTTTNKDFGLLKGRNLIFIQVESLENAVINEKINGQDITPILDQLTNEGLYFSNYYTQVGPGNTADAEFATLNSLYPLPDSVAFIQYAYDHYAALPGLLKANGYSTYTLHGDVPSFWNRANVYPGLGYQKWFSKQDYTIPRNIGTFNLGDKDFFAQSLPKLQSLQQPFMASLITLSSHTPFQIPADLETLAIPATSSLNWLQQQYLQSIHYTDQALGDFIDQLKQAGLYNNSLIVIYGDHGSYTNIGEAMGVQKTIFPDLQNFQVPMIILAPGTNLAGTTTTPASHLDLYPTVADLLGVSPPASVLGQDILTTRDPIVVNRNLISGTVRSFLTNTLAFHDAPDGIFEHGECLSLPSQEELPVATCRPLFDVEDKTTKASDLMIRGDLITTSSPQ